MRRLIFAIIFFLALQGHASLTIYGFGDVGIMPYHGTTKFTKLTKYGGGVGCEYDFLSYASLAAELNYIRGITTDPVPYNLRDKIAPESYGGFNDRGVGFVRVNYWELWIRPKLLIPTPVVQPYLALLLSPLNYGGMQGYPRFGMGLGAVLGAQFSLSSFHLFIESGVTVRSRRGKNQERPPWGMFDFGIPIRLGLGYRL